MTRQRRRELGLILGVLALAACVILLTGSILPGGNLGGGGTVNNLDDAVNGGASAFNVPATDPVLFCADNDGDCTDEPRVEIAIDTGTSTPRVVLRDASDNILPVTHSGGVLTPPVDITAATYTMVASDCGSGVPIRNNDADALEIDAIADPTDCLVCVYDNAGGAITFDPNVNDTITEHLVAGGAGVAATLDAGAGNMACFLGTSTTNWDALIADPAKLN